MTSTRIGNYAVSLELMCSQLPCSTESEATVRGRSCEEARQGVMRVLRYRGWQLGKHTATLCPRHAPDPITCARCDDLTPPAYAEARARSPHMYDIAELADTPRDAHLCPSCARWARNLAFARARERRDAAQTKGGDPA